MLQVGKKSRLKRSVLLQQIVKSDSVQKFFHIFSGHLSFSQSPYFQQCSDIQSTCWFTEDGRNTEVPPINLIPLSCLDTHCFSRPAGTQEDSGGFRHGSGLPTVPGPAGLHARAYLPRWERPGLLPGSPGRRPAQHDQRVSMPLCWKVYLWLATHLTSVLGALWQ